jgi:hypothetical protein
MAWSDAARAAALEMRRRKKAGQPWRREPMRLRITAADSTLVAANVKKVLKNFRVRAVTEEDAVRRAGAFYRKRLYKNVKVIDIQRLARTRENLGKG